MRLSASFISLPVCQQQKTNHFLFPQSANQNFSAHTSSLECQLPMNTLCQDPTVLPASKKISTTNDLNIKPIITAIKKRFTKESHNKINFKYKKSIMHELKFWETANALNKIEILKKYNIINNLKKISWRQINSLTQAHFLLVLGRLKSQNLDLFLADIDRLFQNHSFLSKIFIVVKSKDIAPDLRIYFIKELKKFCEKEGILINLCYKSANNQSEHYLTYSKVIKSLNAIFNNSIENNKNLIEKEQKEIKACFHFLFNFRYILKPSHPIQKTNCIKIKKLLRGLCVKQEVPNLEEIKYYILFKILKWLEEFKNEVSFQVNQIIKQAVTLPNYKKSDFLSQAKVVLFFLERKNNKNYGLLHIKDKNIMKKPDSSLWDNVQILSAMFLLSPIYYLDFLKSIEPRSVSVASIEESLRELPKIHLPLTGDSAMGFLAALQTEKQQKIANYHLSNWGDTESRLIDDCFNKKRKIADNQEEIALEQIAEKLLNNQDDNNSVVNYEDLSEKQQQIFNEYSNLITDNASS